MPDSRSHSSDPPSSNPQSAIRNPQSPLLPLSSLLVADFSRVLAGPLCTMMLADAGARVIKIEEPRGDETRRWGPPFVGGESAYFLSVNRSKESVVLDLKSDLGREAARRLVARADVVVENFRPEQREKFGLTAAAIRSLNRRAIVCSIAGFEPDSPDASLPGYDLLAQAAAGLMAITGEAHAPMKSGVAISDILTAHYAYGAICTALFQRERSDEGDAITVSLQGATAASLANVAQAYLVTGENPARWGNAHPSIVPYQTFDAADRPFALACGTDRHFSLLCAEVLGQPDLAGDERFTTNAARVEHRRVLVPLLATRFRERDAAAWVEACRAAGVPAAPVRDLSEVFESESGLLEEVDHPAVGRLALVRSPVHAASGRKEPEPPPLLGADTARVLRELGFSKAELASSEGRGRRG